jgi:hypothetical protein
MAGPVLSQASPAAPSEAIMDTTTPYSLHGHGQGSISFSQVGMCSTSSLVYTLHASLSKHISIHHVLTNVRSLFSRTMAAALT